jgi:hypothetical protein
MSVDRAVEVEVLVDRVQRPIALGISAGGDTWG